MTAAVPRRSTSVAVPGALFSHTRIPPFPIQDEDDHRIDLRERVGEAPDALVYISPFVTGLRFYLEAHLAEIVADEGIEVTDRSWAIHRSLLHGATDAYRPGRAGVDLQPLATVTRHAARLVVRGGSAFPFAPHVGVSEYTPVGHAVDTALYAIALAATDGRSDADWLSALGIGALFADIGRIELAQSADDAESLTADQRAAIRVHPRRSADMLRECRGVAPAVALHAVLAHHEHWDGSGYPAELAGEAIPYEGRVVALADAFASMTVDRVHSPRLAPFEALTAMAGARGRFDPRLLRALVIMLSGGSGA